MLKLNVFEGLSLIMCVQMDVSPCGDQKRALDPLGLEFQMVISHDVDVGS